MEIFKLKILDKAIIVLFIILSIVPAGILIIGKSDTSSRRIVISIDNSVVKLYL